MFSFIPCLLLGAAPALAGWPSDARWVPLTRDDLAMTDVPFDASGPDRLDLVGDSVSPVGYWTVDSDKFYLRMRVSDDPTDISGPYPVYGDAWGFFIDLDDDDDTYDYSMILADFGATLTVYENSLDEGLGLEDPADDDLETYYAPLNEDVAVVEVVTVGVDHDGFGEDEDYFVDFSMPRDDLERLLHIHSAKPFRVGMGTAYNSGSAYRSDTLSTDLANLYNDAPIDDPTQGLSDLIIFDEDGDGLDYPDEIEAGTDPTDADTDDDGVDDGTEIEDGTDPTTPDEHDTGTGDDTGHGGDDTGHGGDDTGHGGDDSGPPDTNGHETGDDDSGGGGRLPSLDGKFTGGACSATPSRLGLAPLALAGLLAMARRRPARSNT